MNTEQKLKIINLCREALDNLVSTSFSYFSDLVETVEEYKNLRLDAGITLNIDEADYLLKVSGRYNAFHLCDLEDNTKTKLDFYCDGETLWVSTNENMFSGHGCSLLDEPSSLKDDDAEFLIDFLQNEYPKFKKALEIAGEKHKQELKEIKKEKDKESKELDKLLDSIKI